MRKIKAFGLLAILLPNLALAANRVGDADNDGDVDALDAARVQARVLGVIDEFSISPLALADADGDLDLADLMLVAQAATGQRVISGPGGWLNFIDPTSAFATSGGPPVPRLWGIYSNFYGVAENTDGMDAAFSKLPGAAESTVAPASADVAGLGALTYLLPLNTTGVAQNVTVRLTVALQDSSAGALSAYTRNTIVQVAPSVCGNNALEGGEQCDDGNLAPNDGCGPTCQTEFCGDSIVQAGEACDDGVGGTCFDDCSGSPVCGDGVTNGTEECDDFGKCDGGQLCETEADCTAAGSANCLPRSGDGCTAACLWEFCGDGIVNNDTAPYGVTINGMWMDVGGGVRELKDGWSGPDNIFIPDEYNYGMTVRTDTTLAVLQAVSGTATPTGQLVDWAIDRYNPVGPGEAATCNGSGLGPNGVTYTGSSTCTRYHSVLRGTASLGETLSGSTLVVEGTLVNDGFYHWVTNPPTPLPPEVQTLYAYGEFDATTRIGTLRLALQPLESEACDDGPGGSCLDDCSAVNVCGDGIVFGGEACDNGVGGACFDDCSGTNVCGDGIAFDGEACDDGAPEGPGLCLNDCSGYQVCGDGLTNGTEGCDDFGKCDNGAVCGIEQDCIDAGSANCIPRDGDGCSAACVLEFCGDGIINNDTTAYGVTVNGMWMDLGGGVRELKDGWFDPGNILISDQYNYGMTVRTDSTLAVLEAVAGNPTPTGQLVGWAIDRYDPVGPGEAATCNGTGLGPNGVTYSGSSTCTRYHSVLRGAASLTETLSGSTLIVEGTLVNDGFFHWVTSAPTPLPPEVQTLYVRGEFDATTRVGALRLALQPIELEACDDGALNGQPNQCNAACTGTTAPLCGNTVVEAGEVCDDGPGGACFDDCTALNTCGDSIVWEAEACDDGVGGNCLDDCSGLTFLSVSAGWGHVCAIQSDNTLLCWGGQNQDGETSAPSGVFSTVSSSASFNCGVRNDGSISCWGINSDGQTNSPAGNFLSVSTGRVHACGLRTDNTVTCWGYNGSGTSTPPAGTFKQISSNMLHNCGILSDDSVSCWGWDEFGQSAPPGGGFASVSAGGMHTCGIRLDGTLECWGDNSYGQSSPPVGSFLSVSAGVEHTCALRNDGFILCWGANYAGQTNAPGDTFLSVSAGASRTCAIRTNGTALCWGNISVDTYIAPSGGWQMASVGFQDICGVRSDNTLACWGQNTYGAATPPAGYYLTVDVGNAFACSIRFDGTLACWGRNFEGQLNHPAGSFKAVSAGVTHACGTRPDSSIACWGDLGYGLAAIPSGEFQQIGSAAGFSCGLRSDQTITCWGDNSVGQSTPPVGVFHTFSVGGASGCAIRDDGALACWGYTAYGQTTPPAGTFKQVSTGSRHACAIRSDDTVACWGSNDFGAATPPTGTFKSISADGGMTCGIRMDNSLSCWGGFYD